jgi:2-polyprenyl-3-methyl-5-hydroxy-6-metoxy-1,4-benzoquinol methylase
MENRNPEIDQDRVADLFLTYEKYGYVMFPQQERIYAEIAERIAGHFVIEAGCGNGVGSGTLSQKTMGLQATDKLDNNIAFAESLYPWINFKLWDINKSWKDDPEEIVVAIEVFEHVANPQAAMDNLLAACTETLWLSTPNVNVRKLPPDNPYHVWEYTPVEIMKFVENSKSRAGVSIYNWETFEEVYTDTKCDPLVYRINK